MEQNLSHLKARYNKLMDDLEESKERLSHFKLRYETAKNDVNHFANEILNLQKEIAELDPDFEELSYCQLVI